MKLHETPEDKQAVASLLERWDRRDRFVALGLTDYTDMALGLGTAKVGLCVFACSSAHVYHAHERATRMGHEAGAVPVIGEAGEDFKRMLGMVGRAWSSAPEWPHRSLEIACVTTEDAELGLMCVRSEMKKARSGLAADAAELRRLIHMYGVDSAEPSAPMFFADEASKLWSLRKHPKIWRWLAAAAAQPQALGGSRKA